MFSWTRPDLYIRPARNNNVTLISTADATTLQTPAGRVISKAHVYCSYSYHSHLCVEKKPICDHGGLSVDGDLWTE